MKALSTYLLLVILTQQAMASDSVLLPDSVEQTAQQFGVPGPILRAIVLTESGARMKSGRFLPWPWSLNVNGISRRYLTRQDAHRALTGYLAAGVRNIDVGLVQMSWRWHSKQLQNPWMALDPLHNLRVGARYLRECYQRYGNHRDSIACYHVGPAIHKPSKRKAITRYLSRIRKYL